MLLMKMENPCAEKLASWSFAQPWIGMTPGVLERSRTLRRKLLVALAGRVGARRLGAIDDDGLWYILGRSDDTIKIAGKRLGPAEVESILVAHPQVSEAAAVGVPDPIKGEALVCFCVLKKDANGDDDLASALKNKVATELGESAHAESCPVRRRHPENAKRKSHATNRPRRLHRRKARRHIGIGESWELGRNYEKQDEP